MVMCGRQAIDGDTAQVGPQIAEKLGLPQVKLLKMLVGEPFRPMVVASIRGSSFNPRAVTWPTSWE